MADSISGAPFTTNETGKKRTRDFQIGRGKPWLHELDPDTGLLLATGNTGWQRMGNARSCSATLSKETIDHITSEEDFRGIDVQIPIQQDLRGSIQLEEMNALVRDLFLQATAEAVVNGTVAGFTKYTMIQQVKLGRSYEIKDSDGVRCYGVAAEDLVVEVGSTLLELGVDYEVDEPAGEIFFLSTGEEVEDGDPIDVTLDPNPLAAEDMERAPVHSRDLIEVSFKFHATSPRKVNGINRRYELWVPKMNLVPDGNFDLLSPPDAREVQVMPFSWTALKVPGYALGYLTPLPAGGIT